jgi:hypothetical protein
MTDDISKIRDGLIKIKLKTVYDINDDMSNIEDIIDEYRKIYGLARKLLNINGNNLNDVLVNHPYEYGIVRNCSGNLKHILAAVEEKLKYERGKERQKLQESSPRASDLSDRAANQLIDGKEHIYDATLLYMDVKGLYELYSGLDDSFNQRGYTLNNITRALESEFFKTLL